MTMRDAEFMSALYKLNGVPTHFDDNMLRHHYLHFLLKAYQKRGILHNMHTLYTVYYCDNSSLISLLDTLADIAKRRQFPSENLRVFFTYTIQNRTVTVDIKVFNNHSASIISLDSIGRKIIDHATLSRAKDFFEYFKDIKIYQNSYMLQRASHNCGRLSFDYCKILNSIPNAHELFARHEYSFPLKAYYEESTVTHNTLRNLSCYPKEFWRIFKTAQNTDIFKKSIDDDQTLRDYFKSIGYKVPLYKVAENTIHNRSINHKGNKYNQKIKNYYVPSMECPKPYVSSEEFLKNASAYNTNNVHANNIVYYTRYKKARRLIAYLRGLQSLKLNPRDIVPKTDISKNLDANNFFNRCLGATTDSILEQVLYQTYEKRKPSYTFINTNSTPANLFVEQERNYYKK